VAHRNTGLASGDSTAESLLSKVAADENLHMVFYRDIVATALELAPEQTAAAVAAEVTRFEKPGAGLPGYTRRMIAMSDAGIYDVRIHRDDVLAPLFRHWGVLDRPFATDDGRRARAALAEHLDRLDGIAQRQEERRAVRSQQR
jgi:acyl-[acyl-carrier-protein] desaturase